MTEAIVKYQSLTGQEIELTPAIVRQYLVSGQGKITDQEVFMFLELCKYQKLNPFLREAYLIKYGTEKATIVTGKETFLKRAVKNPKYKGHETGISTDGKQAWAKVYVEGYSVPISCVVDWDEYVGKKSDGTVNTMWRTKGKTMLKKVALVQSLREAFPEDFGGLYSPEEINTITTELPTTEVDIIDKPLAGKPTVAQPQAKITPEQAAEAVGGEVVSDTDKVFNEPSELKIEPVISLKQAQRFYGIAKGTKASDASIKDWLHQKYGYKSTKDISKSQYNEICEKVLELGQRESGEEG